MLGFPTSFDPRFEEGAEKASWERYGKDYEGKFYKWEPGHHTY